MGLNRTPLSDPTHMRILKIEFASMSRMAFALLLGRKLNLESCKYINNREGAQCGKLAPSGQSQVSLTTWGILSD